VDRSDSGRGPAALRQGLPGGGIRDRLGSCCRRCRASRATFARPDSPARLRILRARRARKPERPAVAEGPANRDEWRLPSGSSRPVAGRVPIRCPNPRGFSVKAGESGHQVNRQNPPALQGISAPNTKQTFCLPCRRSRVRIPSAASEKGWHLQAFSVSSTASQRGLRLADRFHGCRDATPAPRRGSGGGRRRPVRGSVHLSGASRWQAPPAGGCKSRSRR
jgi:hypothetical protein